MTEQQLARALVQEGLLTAQQVQAAAQQRGGGKGFAQIIVDMGWVSPMDVLRWDPNAVLGGNGAAASVAASTAVAATTAATATPATQDVGLGQDAGPGFDRSGVIIVGEEGRDGMMEGGVVSYCNELLKYAVEIRASDMHLEPRGDGLLPRYRIDGQLRAFGDPVSADLQLPIISRLKVLANLDITETRLPQDGRFRAIVGGRTFDFRVSTLPSIRGEKLVLRLLDHSALVTDLTRLGFTPEMRTEFEDMLHRSYGMILVTGPTGSGKTTTLYGALATTRDETKNVVTVEDPVEYEMNGVTQTSVHTEIGLSFATQLRAILRQDPDVILVGEIRDSETAEISVRAALTGHLLLSTLHTNSAAAAVTRLQDMGLAPFLIASSLSGILAQRLVRLICRHCRMPVPQNTPEYDESISRLRLEPGTVIYHGTGCAECNGTGMRGRVALMELLNVDKDIRRAIMDKADSSIIQRIAMQKGMKGLWQDGIDKLQQGLTTADELVRVLLGAEVADDDADADTE